MSDWGSIPDRGSEEIFLSSPPWPDWLWSWPLTSI